MTNSNMTSQIINRNNRTGGYTLLYSILLSSVVLVVGASILLIGRKEVILAEQASQSQLAIYVADNVLNCFMRKEFDGKLATSSSSFNLNDFQCSGSLPYDSNDSEPSGITYSANGTTPNKTWTMDLTDYYYRLGFNTPNNPEAINDPCASIKVEKYFSDYQGAKIISTRIIADGFSSCNPSDRRRVQRTLISEF